MPTVDRAGLRIAEPLARFIEDRALPGTGVGAGHFWRGLAAILARFAPENAELLRHRNDLQTQLDRWHAAHAGRAIEQPAYQAFLRDIGYLVAEPAPFTIDTAGVDAEVATLAGPQLVVPILNARFLLNAANARWGSLYDARYGTDTIPGTAAGAGYDPARGAAVIDWAKSFLDRAVPLAAGSWRDWTGELPPLADLARKAADDARRAAA